MNADEVAKAFRVPKRLFDPDTLPRVPVGKVFLWKGRMWRRGVGILYAAHPLMAGVIYEGYQRREKRRQAKWAKV